MKFLGGLTVFILVMWVWTSAAWCVTAQESFDSYTVQTLMVPMRDGVKLATDVYRPMCSGRPVKGKLPVLVERTPYNKSGRRIICAYLAERGYVVLEQDCRGRYASQGVFHPFMNEGKDGYDTIEWAAAQHWSNGNVGAFGGSYTGFVEYDEARYHPPHLVAMFVQMAGASLFKSVAYPGGTRSPTWLVWILRSAQTSPQEKQKRSGSEAIADVLTKSHFFTWLRQPPQERGHILRDFPVYFKLYQDFYNHASFDSYWKQRGFYPGGYYREMKDVPILLVTGWYDTFLNGTLDNFVALARMQKTPKKLIVGPWPHGIGTSVCGDAYFGPGTVEDQGAMIADWFDHWMGQSVGRDTPDFSSAPVRLFRMGGGGGSRTAAGKLAVGGEWRNATRWPPSDILPTKYYIHGDGELSPTLPSNDQPSHFTYDPRHPVPTIGGRFAIIGSPSCAQDQVCSPAISGCQDSLPLNRRPDVLSYSSAPLRSPVSLTGSVRATLWVSSDAPDTDFTAKLIDVYPDGYALILADGQIRARYRNSFEKPEMMKPGTPYEVAINLGSTSNLFGTGHRIRLDISSSNFPKFEPNPNTGEPPGARTHEALARNTVYHDAKRPSCVELPLEEGYRRAYSMN
jgi:uncharacterized protein